jgi:hypothetical protein
MTHNHLEQLVAEWYEFKGYFIRRNVLVGRRARGGHECELDVVGFHPQNRHLIHVEPSMDASSWAEREMRYRKKFRAGRRHIPSLFEGLELPNQIEQIALLGYASKAHHQELAGGRIVLVSELLSEILKELRKLPIPSNAISEQLPLLRTLQFVAESRKKLFEILYPERANSVE